jgi:ribosomal-protein-alanine N-acetyltransferase
VATPHATSPETLEAPPPISYRGLLPRDIESLTALERGTFSTPWDPSAFRAFLRPGPAFARVALAGDEVVGYALGWCAPPEAELMNLAVDAGRRGRGIGSALLAWVLETCGRRGARELFLEVRLSNEAAQRLYRRHGFQVCGRRRNYYANPREDALVLRAALA